MIGLQPELREERAHLPGRVLGDERFEGICEGKYDQLPEQAFMYVGGVEEAVEKAKKLQA